MTSERTKTVGDGAFVFWLSFAQLISWGSVFYGFSVFLEPTEQALGIGRAESSLGFSLALLAEGLLAYPVGRWIDRGHERVVMTLGSPFSGDRRANNAWRVYEALNDHKVDAVPFPEDPGEKPPVRTIAVWSPRDGIVALSP